ncbi:MAG TPA: putative zinc-binding metallopeptidase, partial [Chitinophagaceae bacterium]|nr:putative zinc-binding metallopeptidase [Chitinophagaceae bacterium]
HKLDLGERYRTLLGHFRHEIGHYYWDVLIQDTTALSRFRIIFGDEQKDYAEALKTYYETGAPANWADSFISPYSSAHPWEDWAETWAHYFHLMDTVETAYSFGINIKPSEARNIPGIRAKINRDPYQVSDFQVVLAMWIPLTFAINSLNRSMGHEDFYPFVLSPQVMKKLAFIHEICRKKPRRNVKNVGNVKM